MNTFRRGFTRIVYLTGLALVLITLGIEYFQYQRNQTLLLIDLKNRLIEYTANVNLRARTVQGYVNGLKIAAENKLYEIKQFGVKSPLQSYLKNDSERGTYFLDVKDSSLNKAMLGNLTGIGALEGLSEEGNEELNMALSLNTFFELALKNNRGAVWVYYTSRNNFQNVYPWTELTLPLKAPDLSHNGQNFWTNAYTKTGLQDSNVVTNSSPIYDGDRFLGNVSLDLSLIELDRVMNRFPSLPGSLYLINKDHQVLATKGADVTFVKDQSINALNQYIAPELELKIERGSY